MSLIEAIKETLKKWKCIVRNATLRSEMKRREKEADLSIELCYHSTKCPDDHLDLSNQIKPEQEFSKHWSDS